MKKNQSRNSRGIVPLTSFSHGEKMQNRITMVTPCKLKAVVTILDTFLSESLLKLFIF